MLKFVFLLLVSLAGPVLAKSPAFVKLSLYDPVVYSLICRDRLNSTIDGLKRNGRCLETMVDDKYLPLLQKCWHNTTGIEYPSSTEAWITFYCDHKTPWVLKNMAEHCFINRWKKKVEAFEFEVWTDHCVNFEVSETDLEDVGSERRSGEDGDDGSYYDKDCRDHTIDEENDKNECAVRLAHDNRIKKICKENDTKTTLDEIRHHKCIERAAPNQVDIITLCWNIIMKMPYPETDEGWRNLTCNVKYPYAKKRMVMDCVLYQMGRGNETAFKILKKECRGSPYPPDDREYR